MSTPAPRDTRSVAARLAGAENPVTAMRGAWAVTESALALPKDKALAALAAKALGRVEKGAGEALAALEKSAAKKEENAGAYLATLYAALALRNGNALGLVSKERLASFNARAVKLLVARAEKGPLAGLRLIARALLLGAGKVDGKEMTKLFESGKAGDDHNALAALAARKAGGELRLAFRASAPENFAKSGASGAVVLLANRLARPRLPSAK